MTKLHREGAKAAKKAQKMYLLLNTFDHMILYSRVLSGLCAFAVNFFLTTLNRIHETPLHPVKDHDPEEQQHNHEPEAVAQPRPVERAGAERAELERLDEGGDGVEGHDPLTPGRHRAERVDNRCGVHPELHDEGEKDREVAVFRGERGDDDAETEGQAGEHRHQEGEQQEVGGGGNVRPHRQVHHVNRHEERKLDPHPQEV